MTYTSDRLRHFPIDLPGRGDFEPDYPDEPTERLRPNPNFGQDPWRHDEIRTESQNRTRTTP